MRKAVLLAIAIAMFVIAAARPSIVPIAVALVCLLLLATSLSHAGRLSEALRSFRNRPVEILVWGEPLPGQTEASQIESIRAIGAGLHFFLTRDNSTPAHLKIAQPQSTRVGERTAEIGEARYVQWESRKLPRTTGTPAVTVVIRD
jgi:hypothetical protein